MKIELKHIAPYLPYGFRIFLGADEIKEVIGIRDWIGWGVIVKAKFGTVDVPLEAARPILKPLSDYKDINSFGMSNLNIDLETQMEICELANKKIVFNSMSYEAAQVCFENHIDIFGLIDNDLAVDFHTL